MPSTAQWALKKSEAALGKLSEQGMGFREDWNKKFIKLDPTQKHKNKEIWDAFKEDNYRFVARPLGIRLSVDSTWKIQVSDYDQRRSAFIVSPPAIMDKSGQNIGYTLFTMIKVAEEGETFESFMEKISAKYSQKKKAELSTGFGKLQGYEVTDQNVYADKGGAHVHIMGIERNQPEVPGLLLEQPVSFKSKTPGQFAFYRSNPVKGRFEGKIFYVFILDSCEDIYAQSFASYKLYLDTNVVVE